MHAIYCQLLCLLRFAIKFCKVLQFIIQCLLHQASNRALSSPVGVEITFVLESETSSLGNWATSQTQAERLRFSMRRQFLGYLLKPHKSPILGQFIDMEYPFLDKPLLKWKLKSINKSWHLTSCSFGTSSSGVGLRRDPEFPWDPKLPLK